MGSLLRGRGGVPHWSSGWARLLPRSRALETGLCPRPRVGPLGCPPPCSRPVRLWGARPGALPPGRGLVPAAPPITGDLQVSRAAGAVPACRAFREGFLRGRRPATPRPGIMGTVLPLLCAGHTHMETDISLCPRCRLPAAGALSVLRPCSGLRPVGRGWFAQGLRCGGIHLGPALCSLTVVSPRSRCLGVPQGAPSAPVGSVPRASHAASRRGPAGTRRQLLWAPRPPSSGRATWRLSACGDISQVELQRSLGKDVSHGVGEETRRPGPLAHGSAVSPRSRSQLPPPLRHPHTSSRTSGKTRPGPRPCAPGLGPAGRGAERWGRTERRKPAAASLCFRLSERTLGLIKRTTPGVSPAHRPRPQTAR